MPFLQSIGTTEIVIIAIVLMVLFGGKKINEWARGIGQAGKELKKAKKEFQSGFDGTDEQEVIPETPKKTDKKKKEVE